MSIKTYKFKSMEPGADIVFLPPPKNGIMFEFYHHSQYLKESMLKAMPCNYTHRRVKLILKQGTTGSRSFI